ncbi:hypothetical protein C4J98_1529 [Pseudomonas orientalis]|nr:hypothetical protein C4J98_1529 [Pseudomonas orientalis]
MAGSTQLPDSAFTATNTSLTHTAPNVGGGLPPIAMCQSTHS